MTPIRWFAMVALAIVLLPSRVVGQNPPPNPGPGPVEQIGALAGLVRQLSGPGPLSDHQRDKLLRPLDQARVGLLGVDRDAAVESLGDFTARVARHVRHQELTAAQGSTLLALATGIQRAVDLLFQPAPPVALCPKAMPVVHVDDSAPPGGDGSAPHPLPTLGAAIHLADRLALSALEIRLAVGRYEEHLEITRDTRIVGQDLAFVLPVIAGSIQNRGPHCLELRGLAITDSPAGVAGAVLVAHPEAVTDLRRVFILDATGFGIVQHGGRLHADSLVVDGTVPLVEPVGVAMRLSGGVRAHLQQVTLTRNRGGGLMVSDSGTDVQAELLLVTGTTINAFTYDVDDRDFIQVQTGLIETRLPFGILTADLAGAADRSGRAAVDVRSDAVFRGRLVEIVDNEYAGLFVTSRARASLEYTLIERTREVPRLRPQAAGINAWARESGRLFMRYFLNRDSDLCGYVLARDGAADLVSGVVSGHPIGGCVHVTGYDLGRLTADVRYTDNGTNIETPAFPPEPPPPMDPMSLTPP